MSRSAILVRATLLAVLPAFALACQPGEIADTGPDTKAPDMGGNDGVVGDPYNCGELGLNCVGPLAIGECIDEQCGPKLGPECRGPQSTPTCDAYCQAIDGSCAHLGCEGATAYGWLGTQEEADEGCLGSDLEPVALTVACDEPLDGLAMTLRCCCDD